MRSPCYAFLLAALMGVSAPTTAETYQVAPDGSGDYPTIADAIVGAPNNSTIELLPGRFTGPGNRDLYMLGKQLVIRSQSGDPSSCVIDCEGQATAFWYVDSETSSTLLEGVTIVNGLGRYAGGIRILHSDVTIRNCAFRNNTCDPGLGGGGIYANLSSSLIEDCVFEGNSISGVGGGGFCSVGNPAPTLRRCVFIRNHASPEPFVTGAAIYADLSSPTIEECVVFDNDAETGCGGIMLTASAASVTDCVIYSNTGMIGAMALVESTPTVSRCTIANNTGTVVSGVISVYHSDPAFSNSIVAFNRGAIGFYAEPEITLSCCDLFGNEGGDWVGYIADQYGVVGNFSSDPLFCDPTSGDYTLRSDSPCLADNNPDCDQVGALGVGCDEPVATRTITWGGVRVLFRW